MITKKRKIELMKETIELAKNSIAKKGKLSPKVWHYWQIQMVKY